MARYKNVKNDNNDYGPGSKGYTKSLQRLKGTLKRIDRNESLQNDRLEDKWRNKYNSQVTPGKWITNGK